MPDFPAPSAAALEQSARLAALIADEIAASGGWMPFHRYMALALYAPGLGYYAGGARKFGAEGDFVTAPELTPLFGEALAAQLAEIMAASARDMIEAGAGSGHLAADLLCEFARRDCLPARYGILELSAELRARQRETLIQRAPGLASRVYWLDTLPEAFSGAVLANEVLDAMPLHVIAVRGGRIFERGVSLSEDAAQTCGGEDRPASGALLEAARRLPLPAENGRDGGEYVTEINLAAAAWISAWRDRLQKGALLLIDYGYPRGEFYLPTRARGTLMCHYRHRAYDDPFLWPGLADITGSVDFTAMAEAGFDAGLEVLGYASQGPFLLDCGLLECLARRGPRDGADFIRAAGAVQRLILPHGMGELFKVLALGRGIDVPLLGFTRADRRHAL